MKENIECKPKMKGSKAEQQERKPMICNICQKGFKTDAQILKHQLRHLKFGRDCHLCSAKFSSNACRNRHLLKQHEDDNGTKLLRQRRTWLKCPEDGCDFETDHRRTSIRHARKHTPRPKKVYKCDDCDKVLRDKHNFERHKGTHKQTEYIYFI